VDKECGNKNNLKLQNACNSPDILSEINIRRLEWLGHVIKMEDTRILQMVFNIEPEVRHGVRRPKLRELYNVEVDMKIQGA
jgi:hypothetical protein